MTSETIGVTITYREPITFHLRMISIDEETKLRQRMFGLTEEEKAEKAYQNNIDMLADLSESVPTARRVVTTMEKRDGDKKEREYAEIKEVELVEGKSAAAAVREYFAEKSSLKERVAEYAVRGYFIKLQPEVSFF